MGGGEHDQCDGRATVGLGVAQLVAHGRAGDRPILGLDDDPNVRTAGQGRVQAQDEVALLRAHRVALAVARPIQQIACAPGNLGQHPFEELLEVAALGAGLCPLRATSGRRGLDGREPVVESREALADLGAKLMQRRVQARRIEQNREPGGIAVEVGPEKAAHPADRAVPLRFVEQVADERLERAAIAKELLERARKPAVAVREVLAEHFLQGSSGLVVRALRLGEERFELAPDDVDVDADAGLLERSEPDSERALDQRGPIVRRPFRDERGSRGIEERDPLQNDSIADHLDPRRRRQGGIGRERDKLHGFHGGTMRGACDS